ncbi:hypothetical protein GGI15_002180 [Coemansia interrupta]|uniref:Uncharacterized protein n=1 Tax=Coemansia interrupta TaxID=1126814 RepID=A0A9W8HJL0_9FUNG|nr:hypothetical protein GGI15_002180 [Coemansia interrupta]
MPPHKQQKRQLQQPSQRKIPPQQQQKHERRVQKPPGLKFQALPKGILERVFSYNVLSGAWTVNSTRTYDWYCNIYKLSLLSRGIRAVLRPYLFEMIFFERHNLAIPKEEGKSMMLTIEETKAAKVLSPVIKWRSNIKLVRVTNMISYVRTVSISTTDRYPDPDDVLKMLKEHGFDNLRYTSVTRLIVKNKSDFDVDDKPSDDASDWIPDESFNALSQYLTENLPHVQELWLDDKRCMRVGPRNAMSPYIAENLDKMRRLELSFAHMPVFGVKTLPMQITHLRLTVHGAYNYIDIPRIATPMLQVLSLSAIPIDCLWQRFVQPASGSDGSQQQQQPPPGFVDFPELRSLSLTFYVPYRSIPSAKTENDYMWENYKDDAIRTKPESYKGNSKLKTISVQDQSPKYHVLRTDSRRPRFPKLTSLSLNQYPGRVSEFLKDVPVEQLVSLRLSGYINTFKGFRMNGFTSLRICSLMQFSELKHRQLSHGNRFFEHAMMHQSPALQSLHIVSSTEWRLRLPPVDKIQCSSIRRLRLSVTISFEDIPALLRCLPLLELLDLEHSVFPQPPLDAQTSEGLADILLTMGFEPISTSLLTFTPDVLCRNSNEESLFYNVFLVIARVPSLRKLCMYSFYASHFFEKLLSMLKIPRLFPFIRHLASIECGDSNRLYF